MNMKNVILSILVCGLFATSGCMAQTVRDVMYANQKVFELVDAYVDNANLTERYAQKIGAFRNLFESQNTTVYMDHIDWYNNSNRKDSVTLSNYCAFYEQQQGTFRQFDIKDVQIDRQSLSDIGGIYTAVLTKEYNTITDTTPVVSRLVLVIDYSFVRKAAKIVRIECTRADNRMKPHILANYENNTHTLYIPKTLKVKEVGGDETYLDSRVQPLSAEMYKQLSKQNCATFQYEFTPHNDTLRYHTISVNTVKNAVGLELGYVMPLSMGNIEVPSDADYTFENIAYRSHTFRVGATYLRQIFAKGRHRVSFETGLVLDIGVKHFSADTYVDQYDTIDTDGARYTRKTQLLGYDEACRSISFAIPAIVRYDYYVIPSLSVFAAVGLRGAMAFISPAKASFNGHYAGLYGEEYYNVLIDQNGYYDFGTFDVVNLSENVMRTHRWLVDALARIGAQYFITSDKRWSLDFSAGYRYRILTKPAEQHGGFRLSANSADFSSVCRNLWTQPTQFLDFQLGVKYNF